MIFPDTIVTAVIKSVAVTLMDASFYLLFGLLAAGMIKSWVDEKRIVSSLGSSTFGSVVKASLVGIPLPLCSCSVVPMALSVREKGASRGATVSFLISTPETGVDSVAVTYALLDPLMTAFRPVSAMITALIAGVVENVTGNESSMSHKKSNPVAVSVRSVPEAHPLISADTPRCRCAGKVNYVEERKSKKSFQEKMRNGIRYAFVDLLGDIAFYLMTGLILSGLISVFIPADWFIGKPEWLVMLMMLLTGIPLYVCASASTPVAAALILKGVSPGAALIFLLAGPATNIATLSIVGRTFGIRAAVYYVMTIMTAALIMGMLLNVTYSGLNIAPTAIIGSGAHILPEWVKTGSAVLLFVLILYHSYLKLRKRGLRRNDKNDC